MTLRETLLSKTWVHLGVVTVVAWTRVAAAHEGEGETAPAAQAGTEEAGHEGEPAHEAEEKPFSVGLDPMIGWGSVPFAAKDQNTYSRDDATHAVVESFIVGGSWEVREGLAFGARVPFSFGTFSPAGSEARSAAAFGNVEVEGETARHLGEHVELSGAMGVALPTAQGDEIPEDLSKAPAGSIDRDAYDRYSLARAAAFARGYEDNALFEPRRVGLIPKVTLTYRAGGLTVVPYVKVENLLGPSSDTSAGYVGELVPGVAVGYRVARPFEVGLRGWANVGFAGTAEERTTSAAVEPRIALVMGPVHTFAGFMVPLAGPPSDAGFLALRLGATVAF